MINKNSILILREKIRIEKCKSKILRSYDELQNTIKKRSIARKAEKECEIFFSSIISCYGADVFKYETLERIKEDIENIESVFNVELLIGCDVEFIGCWVIFQYKSIYSIASFEMIKGGYRYKSLTFR